MKNCFSTIFFSILLILGTNSAFSGEECIDRLKELFKDNPPIQTGKCEDVRELKYPGQTFVHTMDMTIAGKGVVETPHWFGWFHTRETIDLVHESSLILKEEVISSNDELASGIIRTKYRVQLLNESLAQAKGQYELGFISTKKMFRLIKTIGEKYGSDGIEKNNWWWLLPPLKLGNKLLLEMADDSRIQSDGTKVIDQKTLGKIFPEYEQMVAKFRDFTGTEIYAEWQYGRGYTSIRFETTKLDADTKDALAKLIYRTNPIGVRNILPEGKSAGESWFIDSVTIGGIIFDLGLDFDDVEGSINCKHSGPAWMDGDDLPDEYTLLNKEPIKMQAIQIPRDSRSRLSLVSRGGKAGDISVSFSPEGNFYILDEHDANERHIYYLKEAHLSGNLESKVQKKTSLLKDVEFKTGNLKIKIDYTQNRMSK